MSSRQILVTGNAGFIGSHLTDNLVKRGNSVIGVDNFNDFYSPKFKEKNIFGFKLKKNFKQYRQNITNITDLERVFEENQIDTVVHLAARAGVRASIVNPRLYQQVNVGGTLNLLELARKFKSKQFIFGSSSSVYGNQKKTPFSETDPVNQPVSPYAATKKAGEMLSYSYSYLHEIKMTVLRFFTVYGPRGRPDMAPYIFTKAISERAPIIRYGNGSSRRDYTYVDDIVKGIVRAIDKPFKFEVINLGSNQPVKLNDFIKTIEKLTGKKAKIRQQPRNPADVKQTFAEIKKAKRLLNWQPEVDLEKGMKQFIDWYGKRKN